MTAISSRLNTILLVLVLLSVLTLIGTIATRGWAGPLDPPGAPASTGLPIDEAGSWSRNLSGVGGCNSPRFKCVLPTVAQPTGEGVLDRDTGLVWQRTAYSFAVTWNTATGVCASSTTGDRLGWRLPTHAELRSIANVSGDGVPVGMPLFSGGVASREYWSATTWTEDVTKAWHADFDLTTTNFIRSKTDAIGVWCVRGISAGDD